MLRFLGIFGDLWLDEIWSLHLVSGASTLREVISIPHDNSHPLNSLWLYLCGPEAPFWVYRIFAFVCSVFTVLLIWRWMPQEMAQTRPFILAGAALSYPLIVYGSEARGYAPMLLCAVLSLRLEIIHAQSRTFRSWLTLTFVLVIGCLSHLAFLHLIIAIFFSRFVSAVIDRRMVAFVARYLPMAALIAMLVYWQTAGMGFGGGTRRSVFDTVLSAYGVGTIGTGFSFLGNGWLIAYTCFAIVVFLLASIEALLLWRTSRHGSLMLCVLLLLVPAGFIWVIKPGFSEPRYLFFTILAASFAVLSFCARLYYRDRLGRIFAVILLCVCALGNLYSDLKLALYGRGNYSAALDLMRAQSAEWPVSVYARHQFRATLVLNFYAERAGIDAPRVVSDKSAPWAIIDYVEEDPLPVEFVEMAVFDTAPLSGSKWGIFTRK